VPNADVCDYLVIGCCAAGVAGIEGIRKRDKEGSIVVVGEEDVAPYTRCLLTDYMVGEVDMRKLTYRPMRFFEINKVRPMLGKKAVKLDANAKQVTLASGEVLSYRKLLLATGSSAVLYDVPGKELEGVHVLKCLRDAEGILADAKKTKKAVVMGGGLVGIMTATALAEMGLDVCLAVTSPHIMSQNIDDDAAAILEEHLREHKMRVLANAQVVEMIGKHRIEGVKLADGTVIECGVAVSAKGVRPNLALAEMAGIKGRRGILVDDHMLTTSPDAYAAGDVVECKGFISGELEVAHIWPVAVEQGHIAGENMAGGDVAYAGVVGMNTTTFFGLPVVNIGESKNSTPEQGEQFLVSSDTKARRYKKVVLRDGKVVGAVLMGDVDNAGVYKSMICTRVDVRAIREMLLAEEFDFGKLADALLTKQAIPPGQAGA
jgi:NAD(P)H-nitrite reductase large subunit